MQERYTICCTHRWLLVALASLPLLGLNLGLDLQERPGQLNGCVVVAVVLVVRIGVQEAAVRVQGDLRAITEQPTAFYDHLQNTTSHKPRWHPALERLVEGGGSCAGSSKPD